MCIRDSSRAKMSWTDLRNTVVTELTQIDPKWRLVWEIVNQGAMQRDLSRADLAGANLREANLNGADLRAAKLWLADLGGADLRRANLRNTDLRESNLVGADLRETNLQDTNLTGARYDSNTRWPSGFDPLSSGALARAAAARPEALREPMV